MGAELAQVIQFPTRERERLLKVSDLVRMYGFSERWWRYRIAEGLPRHRWGGQYRFYASEVEAWIERRGRGL